MTSNERRTTRQPATKLPNIQKKLRQQQAQQVKRDVRRRKAGQ